MKNILNRTILTLTLIAATLVAPQKANAISPGWAGTISVVPGLGQIASGRVLQGLGFSVASLGLYFSGNKTASDIGYKIWSYNLYDAYQGAGGRGVRNGVFVDYIAAFNPLNIIDPVGAGILGYGVYTAAGSNGENSNGPKTLPASAAFFAFVGLGEEGLFRGFLFPALSDAFWGSKWAGAIVSSAAFSASHLTNKSAWYHSFKGLATLFLGGMLLCWELDNNNYDIRHNIFTHSWYDVIVDYGGRKGTSEAPDLKLGAKVTFLF